MLFTRHIFLFAVVGIFFIAGASLAVSALVPEFDDDDALVETPRGAQTSESSAPTPTQGVLTDSLSVQQLLIQNQQLLTQNQQLLIQNQNLLALVTGGSVSQPVATPNTPTVKPVVTTPKPTVTATKPVAPAPTPSAPSGITMADVATHNSSASCYTVIRGTVYDVTSFIPLHPGGSSKITRLCGRDGTRSFVGEHGGDSDPEQTLTSFKVAALTP